MGDSHCSKIAVMQLFHELKQQFPALPDHIISQCIAQNSCNRQTCEKSLQKTQELRPPLGKFPPVLNANPTRSIANQNSIKLERTNFRPHRPASLDIQKAVPCESLLSSSAVSSTPTSAPPIYADRTFFEQPQNNSSISGFEVNVNVACNPANSSNISNRNSTIETQSISSSNRSDEQDYSRSYTSVSLTLRPPSSEPQVPIEIRSKGSRLTYTTSSMDPHGYQSHLQISIGSSNPTSVTTARIKHPMHSMWSNSLTPTTQNILPKPPGLPTGPVNHAINQAIKSTKTMSAPTTPSNPPEAIIANSGSLPTTPTMNPEPMSTPCNILKDLQIDSDNTKICSINNELTDYQKQLIEKQLIKKNRLAQALQAEKEKLEAMKSEIKKLSEPKTCGSKFLDARETLRSQIHQLRLECDLLTKEIDKRSEQKVPLGETNEEFYRSIYTGQKIKRTPSRVPPIPSQPPVWQMQDMAGASRANPNVHDDEREERLGPSWVCSMCTFANHPLINACEQCNMPQLYCVNKPGTVDNKKKDSSLCSFFSFSTNIDIKKQPHNTNNQNDRYQ